eukprot:885967-Amphidinium_carterae.1
MSKPLAVNQHLLLTILNAPNHLQARRWRVGFEDGTCISLQSGEDYRPISIVVEMVQANYQPCAKGVGFD